VRYSSWSDWRGGHLPYLGLEPVGGKIAEDQHIISGMPDLRPLTGVKLYCLVMGVQGCEQLAQESLRSRTRIGSRSRDLLMSQV